MRSLSRRAAMARHRSLSREVHHHEADEAEDKAEGHELQPELEHVRSSTITAARRASACRAR